MIQFPNVTKIDRLENNKLKKCGNAKADLDILWSSFVPKRNQIKFSKSHKDIAATFLLLFLFFPLSWQENKAGVTKEVNDRWVRFLPSSSFKKCYYNRSFWQCVNSLFRCALYFLVIPLVLGLVCISFFRNVLFCVFSCQCVLKSPDAIF